MNTRSRLLGLAFAAADALVEVDGRGVIAFAVGAAPESAAEPVDAWIGRPLSDLVGRAGRPGVRALLSDPKPGVRSAPVEILMRSAGGRVRKATLRVFPLPDLAPAVSCAITYDGAPFVLSLPAPPVMPDAGEFLHRARDTVMRAESPLTLTFVDVPGLAAADDATGRARVRVEAALQAASVDGASAGRVTPERFALLQDVAEPGILEREVRDAAAAEGLTLEARAAASALPAGQPLNMLRALRFTLEDCLRDGGQARPAAAFETSLRRTIREADRFREAVRAREFLLHYQPIVALDTGAVHHFEALARFGQGDTGAIVRMAEELGMVEALDVAVLEQAIVRMRRPGAGLIRVAVNVSAASMADDSYVDALLRLTANAPDDRRRLMVEVTETAALADPDGAERRLGRLRAAGVRVCIDDFGAGAASFDYLRRLTVDVVKIDGAFVADLDANPRSRKLVSHLVGLCADLGVATIAEMIETRAVADAARALGVTYGQGWLFGRPAAEPATAAPAPVPVRRVGAVAGWA